MKKPEALRLAGLADYWSGIYPHGIDTAIELRRMHEVNHKLLAALQGVIRVADRATDEFDAARSAIQQATESQS